MLVPKGAVMIDNGNATLFVSDMDRAVEFYTQTLGLKLRRRFGNHWAEVEAGPDLVIGLHPASEKSPAPPGTTGSVQIGLSVDEPLETVIAKLHERGVTTGPVIVDDDAGRFASLADPDGNTHYLWENKPQHEPA